MADLLETLNLSDYEKYQYEERAAICEYEGNMTRKEAERQALKEIYLEREKKKFRDYGNGLKK